MPIYGKENISTKPRPKSIYDYFSLVYCFIVLLFFLSPPRPKQYISYSYGKI